MSLFATRAAQNKGDTVEKRQTEDRRQIHNTYIMHAEIKAEQALYKIGLHKIKHTEHIQNTEHIHTEHRTIMYT